MGIGFGLSRKQMLSFANSENIILRDVQSLTDWLWYINAKGSLAEAVAATSYAIEGVTGDISKKVVDGFFLYQKKQGVSISDRTLKWMREHAHYDDMHPKVALEVVKKYALTQSTQTRVMLAARRSLQLLDHALDTSLRAYAPIIQKIEVGNFQEKRGKDRRKQQTPINFPERRFREQRGATFLVTA